MTPRHVSRFVRPAAAALLLGAAAVACSPVARYRVLSTLFDGVPAPEGVEAPASTDTRRGERGGSVFADGLQKLREQKPKRTMAPTILSVHKPVADRDCKACHDAGRAVDEVAHDATLCDRCHGEQRKKEGWDHGPINLGTCIPCHEPHRSPYERLLSEPLPELCLNCHTDSTYDGAEYHRVPNFGSCTECHDPHRMY